MSNNVKKLVTFLFVAIIAVGVIFWYIGKSNPKNKTGEETSASGELLLVKSDTSKLAELSRVDSDGDGLLDWEEALWKTNKTDKDTDNDGTSDGEEVRASRDPNLAGPNDNINEVRAKDDSPNFEGDKKLTATDIFARNFFSNYTSLSSPGIDSVSKEAILKDLVSSTENTLDPKITLNTKVSSTNTTEAYKQYGNSLALILATNADKISNEELPLFEAYTNGDLEAGTKLKLASQGYGELANLVEKISVPSDIKTYHENLVKALKTIKIGLDNLLLVEADPLTSVFGLKQYEQGQEAMYGSIMDIRSFLTEKGVVYDKSEPGYIFIYI